MPRPVNLERLAEREEAILEKEKAYQKKRDKDAKAHHKVVSKAQQKRLMALGQIVYELWPDKSITAIASILHRMHGHPEHLNGQDAGVKRTRADKKSTFKDFSDTVIPSEARDDEPETVAGEKEAS